MKKILIILSTLLIFLSFTACSFSSEPDGAVGTYYFVYEKAPLKTIYERDSKMILDGKGGGEYYKEEYVHKIKYKFEAPNIVITDNNTGIVYKGTLEGGELKLLDGELYGITTSEFLFKSKIQ